MVESRLASVCHPKIPAGQSQTIKALCSCYAAVPLIIVNAYQVARETVCELLAATAMTMAGFSAQDPRQMHGLSQIVHSSANGRRAYLQSTRLSSALSARAACFSEWERSSSCHFCRATLSGSPGKLIGLWPWNSCSA